MIGRLKRDGGSMFVSLESRRLLSGAYPPVQSLLTDDFNVSANSTDVNLDLATRQGGSLSPISYTKGAQATFSQVGNGEVAGGLLLAGRTAGDPGEVSLDHNFDESLSPATAEVIEFDVRPVLTGRSEFNTTESSWVAIDFGASAVTRNAFPQFSDGIGLLFRGNGQTQAFADGTNLGNSSFAPQDAIYHHIRIEIRDIGNGTAFQGDGSPVLVTAYADGSTTPFFSDLVPHGFRGNYISFIGEGEGSGGDGVVRHGIKNLVIGTSAPAAAATLTQGALFVAGTAGDDTIGLSVTGSQLAVSEGQGSQSFPLDQIESISVQARAGNDRINIGAGVPGAVAFGGSGDDTIVSMNGNDTLGGGAGKDSIHGGSGNNLIIGGRGADSLVAGTGNDTLDAGRGFDSLAAGSGHDLLLGGAGNDTLSGGALDTLDGGPGNNVILSG